MLKTIAEQLTRRGREIMNALFALGNRASAEEIRAPDEPARRFVSKYNIQLRTEVETQTDGFGSRTFQFPNLFHDMQS